MSYTLELQPNTTDGIDTSLYEISPTLNYGATIAIYVAKASGAADNRGLIQFDLGTVLPGADIISAVLSLFCAAVGAPTATTIAAHRSLAQWYDGEKDGVAPDPGQDGSTWNLRNANGSVAWLGGAGGAAGRDYAVVPSAREAVEDAGSWYTWDLTEDVRRMVKGLVSNYGWWLISDAEDVKAFLSSDYVDVPARRPKLTITVNDDPHYSLGIAGSEVRLEPCECLLSMGQEQFCRELRTAQGALRRDVIAVKRSWDLTWKWLPGRKSRTFHGGLGRDDLAALYASTANTPPVPLHFHLPDKGGEGAEVLFVPGSWREKLLQRGPQGAVWECRFTLVEI